MERKKLIRNRAKCNACGDVIESTHVHDFVSCSCESTFVDGGLEYARRGFGEKGFTEMAEYAEDERE